MKFNKITLILSIISVLTLSACVEKEADTKKEEKVYKVPVETIAVQYKDVSNTYKTTAVLEARSESRVVNKVTGMIEEVLVEEGQFVKKGQILASIDSERYQLELERASIDLASVTAEYNRSQPVAGKQLISTKDLEKLGFMVKSRKNEEKLAKMQVRDSKVRAPISGVVAARMVKAGNMTKGADSEMFHIVALETLQGVVYLPESEIQKVHVGQVAQLLFPASKKVPVEATVALISPIVDSKSGTFKVTLNVDNTSTILKPGMFAKVALVLDIHEQTQVVPQKALIVTDTEVSMFVVDNGKAKKLVVETGYEQDGLIEVLTPLKDDTQIVVVGQQSLKVDSEVNVLNAEVEEVDPVEETSEPIKESLAKNP